MDAPETTQESAMSMFRANGPMMITGGHYIISTTASSSTSPHTFRQVLVDLFEKHVALSATHDTIDDHRSERLSPTHALSPAHSLLLARLLNWAHDTSPHAPPILWLTGPSDCGKTAIADLLAEELQKHDMLGATFFLNPRGDASEPFLVPTLALQLCESIPALQPLMIDVMQRAPFLFQRSLPTQMERLIVRPLLSLPLPLVSGASDYEGDDSAPAFRPVIIIDGLDSHHAAGGAAERVLRAIQDAAPRLRDHVKFVLLSRLEPNSAQASLLDAVSGFTLHINLTSSSISDSTPAPTPVLIKPRSIPTLETNEATHAPPIDHNPETFYMHCDVPTPETNKATHAHLTDQNPETFYMPPILSEDDGACVECKMRDLEMADVDVTSPGVWERDSDICHSEHKSGRLPSNDTAGAANDNDGAQTPRRRITFADPLTEGNLKAWLKEPSHGRKGLARIHILNGYLESQLELLRAECALREEAGEGAQQSSQAPNAGSDNRSDNALAEGQELQPHLAPVTQTHERSDSFEQTELNNQLVERHEPGEASVQDSDQRQPPSDRPPLDSSLSSTASDPSSISSSAEYTTDTDTLPEAQMQLAADARRLVGQAEPVSWVGRFAGVLTSPLDELFNAWTTLCVQQWP